MVGHALLRAGMARQVTYHLLAGAGAARAPWAIITIAFCLPVLVLAMGTALAHMLRDDALTTQAAAVPDPRGDQALRAESPGRRPRLGARSRAESSLAEQA
jgi:hypothetical protein